MHCHNCSCHQLRRILGNKDTFLIPGFSLSLNQTILVNYTDLWLVWMASIENVMVPIERSRCLQIRYTLVPDTASSWPTELIHAINGPDIKCQHFISGMRMQSFYFFIFINLFLKVAFKSAKSSFPEVHAPRQIVKTSYSNQSICLKDIFKE